MPHGIIATVPVPIDMYRAVNSAVMQELGSPAPGLLVHIARETPDGFQVIEIWESKELADDFQDRILAPIIDRVSEGNAPNRADVSEEFVVENLMLGAGSVAGAAG